MKLLVLISILLGLSSALQYPVEYHYRYESRLATGIPEIRSQMSALGLRADVVVQVKSKVEVIVKLTNVKIGQQNEDLPCCHLRQPISFQYRDMPQKYKTELEQPFSVNLLEEKDNVMKVIKSDIEIVTNIRKALVGILRVEPVLANLGGIRSDKFAQRISSESGKAPEVYSLEEESIFGRCQSEYSFIPLPEYMAERVKQTVEEHIQHDEQAQGSPRSKTSNIPKLKEEYYRVERVINFDKCHDRVVLQHAGYGNMTDVGKSQFKSIQSRSSVGTYIMKGAPGSLRVERAIIEGDIATNPFGYKTHRIHAITNQTLYLEKAQAILKTIPLPAQLKTVKTWRYEVASPFSPPAGTPKPWVNYHKKGDRFFPVSADYVLLGIEPKELAQQYKNNIWKLLDSAVYNLHSTPSNPSDIPDPRNTKTSVAVTDLHHIARMLRSLPLPEVRQIFDTVFREKDITGQRKQRLLVDAASASGAAAPIKVILEKIKSGQISPQRAGSILWTIPNNLITPVVIPELMEYAMSLSFDSHPILKSTALVNFASLAERVCLSPKKFNYTISNPVFGQHVCKPSEILQKFLPYLKQQLQQRPKHLEKAIVLQAIANLGTPQILPVLKPYVLGKQVADPRVRSIAIYGLTKRRLPSSAREQVFDTLMEVIDNVAESTLVRQSAFITLLTWHPSSTWYQKMARLTWRDPSQNFASFVAYSFESLSKSTDRHFYRQARYAAFALPLMKPFSPSVKYSFESAYRSYDQGEKLGLGASFVYLESAQEMIPKTIYGALTMNHGDLRIPAIEAAVDTEGMSELFYDILQKVMPEYDSVEPEQVRPSPKHHSERHIRSIVDHITQLYKQHASQIPPLSSLYLRSYENMYQYIPVDPEIISKLAGPSGRDLLRKLLEGVSVNVTKFLNPTDLEFFYPTEAGLPLTGLVHTPIMLVGDAELKLVVEGISNPTFANLPKAKKLQLLFKTDFKYARKIITQLSIPAPWNDKVIESGVENLQEINLPIKGKVEFEHHPAVKNLTIEIKPTQKQQIPVVHTHNLPYTVLRDFVPSAVEKRDFKIIPVQKDRQPLVKTKYVVPEKYTGLDIQMKYDADVSPPVSAEVLLDYVRKPERLMKAIHSPTAKQYQYTVLWKPTSETKEIVFSLGYYSSPPGAGVQKRTPVVLAEHTPEQRLQELRHLAPELPLKAVSTQLTFRGEQFRRYESLVAVATLVEYPDTLRHKVLTTFSRTPIPGYSEVRRVLTTLSEIKTPLLPDLENLRKQIQSQLEAKIETQVFIGSSPQPQRLEKIATLKGLLEVSPKRRSEILRELESSFSENKRSPVVELRTPAVYDEAQVEIDYVQSKLPVSLLNVSYQVQDTLEGYLYPHGYFNHLYRGEQNKLSLKLKRPLSSQRYTIEVETPIKRSVFDEIRVPDILTRIVPWTGLRVGRSARMGRNPQSQVMVLAKYPSNTCRITNSQVVTYDSVQFDYSPLFCWTTAAFDSRNIRDFFVYTRKTQSGQFEVFANWPEQDIDVIFSRHEAKINGMKVPRSETKRIIKTTTGKPLGYLFSYPDYYELKMNGRVTIRVKDDVEIIPEYRLQNVVRGICGDFDGEKNFEFTGPRRCLYTNHELFKFAYTIPKGDNCNLDQYNNFHTRVVKFQQNCSKRPANKHSTESLMTFYASKLTGCRQDVYPVQRKGPALCVALEAVQLCTDKCRPQSKQTETIMSKCWLKKNAPQEVKSALAKGYLTHPVTAPAKFEDQLQVQTEKSCKKV